MNLQNRKILICVSGGIAAYKIPLLVRIFIRAGAEVQVLMTPAAKDFVSDLTLATLSRKPVYSSFYGDSGTWNNHVEMALWADVILVAPCTASTLSKLIHGNCDNLVIATLLSAKCPVFIAPAMDLDMYQHPSTQQNLETAQDWGYHIIPAESGELASGLIGQGRMAEPETIAATVKNFFEKAAHPKALDGKTVLITAGPTYEAIDPVRFIGNHSSGKMGFALAHEAAARGAKVILISGPTTEKIDLLDVQLFKVTSAQEMFDMVFEHFDNVDIAIASAAVADYAPKNAAPEKIKKESGTLALELVKNPDILKTMGERKKNQVLIGFALETQDEIRNATEKLHRKNLDMIVLNSLKDEGAGFGGDTNKITIISQGSTKNFGVLPKIEVAAEILNFAQREILK